MKDQLRLCIVGLYQSVPTFVYLSTVALFFAGTIAIFSISGLKNGWRKVCRLLLSEFVILIYCSTVVFRSFRDRIDYNFNPFWSYEAYDKGGRPDLLPENLLNLVLFVPVGILLGCAFRKMSWWKVALTGGSLSISIEILQFFYKRGFSEIDDVMHNTVGCLIGYGMYRLVQVSWSKIYGQKSAERSVDVL